MSIKTSILKKAIYVIIPLVLVAILVIKLKNNKEITQNKVYQYNKEQPINVQADTLQVEIISSGISYTGTFEPNKETKVSAEVQGKINKILVDVGSVVYEGQTLIQLDNSLLKLQLQAIEVQMEGLEADVKRYTILSKADAIQGVQLEKAELGLKAAKVQRASLLEQINKTTIRAPFSGVITSKLNEEGAFAAPGIPLLQITDIRTLKFTVNVAELELSIFKVNENYLLAADAFPETTIKGKAIMKGSKANSGSSFPVQFSVNNTNDLLIKAGMFGKVYLKSNIQENGIVISSSSIVGTETQPQVYVIKNSKVSLKNIAIGKKIQNKTIVSSGLQPGDVIVTNGFINLFDGANVTVK